VGLFNLVPALYRAWQDGEIIRNPAKWKSGGELVNAVTGVVTAIVSVVIYFNPDLVAYLSEDFVKAIIPTVVSFLVAMNILITRITTKKEVGLDVLIAEKVIDSTAPDRRDEGRQLISSTELEGRHSNSEDLGAASELERRDRKSNP